MKGKFEELYVIVTDKYENLLQDAKGLVSKEEPVIENAEAIKDQVVEEVKAEAIVAKKPKAKK